MSRKAAAQQPPTRPKPSGQQLAGKDGEVKEAKQEAAWALARRGEALPPTLHVLPLSERPFFAGQTMPLVTADVPTCSKPDSQCGFGAKLGAPAPCL